MTSKNKIVNKSSKDILTYSTSPLYSTSNSMMKFSSTKFLNKTISIRTLQSQKANQVRTHLLLLLSSECNRLIKEQKSMINSRTFAESEKEFCNDHMLIHLKPEVYSAPVDGNEVGRLYKSANAKDNFNVILSSPGFNGSYCQASCIQCSLGKRETLGRKKMDHFKKTFLTRLCNDLPKPSPRKSIDSFMFESHLELINVEDGITKNINTQRRVEQGFAYLQKLCHELKNANLWKKRSVCSDAGDICFKSSKDISSAVDTPETEDMVPTKLKTIDDEIEYPGPYSRRRSSLTVSNNLILLSQGGQNELRKMNSIKHNRKNKRHDTNYDSLPSTIEEFSVVRLRHCMK